MIRRAVKLADHFGAVVQHAPMDSAMASRVRLAPANCTLSAFEYLKRPDVIKLQNCWTTEQRKTCVTNGTAASAKPAPFPAELLGPMIPNAPSLLQHKQLPVSLSELRLEQFVYCEPPDYITKAPGRNDFWATSRDGNTLSPYGCYSIFSEPTLRDYDAIVETQQHLKELGMLHEVSGMAAFKLLTSLKSLAAFEGSGPLVKGLVEGLEAQTVRVYKGLDTGFRIPDSDASFWGVSRSFLTDKGPSVEIFISQKAPSEVSAVLHTWLADRGLPRDLRYHSETLLEIESENAETLDLPLSIKSAIERATTAETLQLLQQIQITHLGGPFERPMIRFCRLVLLDRATTKSRMRTYGRKLLDGSLSMRDALEARLESLVRLGAIELPCLESFVELHSLVEESVRDALFYGDKASLNAFVGTLNLAFEVGSSSPGGQLDVNANLFALIFFGVLRQAAFEDVYIEATDRCPILLQPDQTAVFSELWVLGSQCESYFGILPRDLGEIIYERYRLYLKDVSPMASHRANNEIMTMYSSSNQSAEAATAAVRTKWRAALGGPRTVFEKVDKWKTRFTKFGAMSIFCLPAILDVTLLTFLGRGMFMTAFMPPDQLNAAVYALLISLLLSAGVVGWIGSTGNYYLAHYAYDNMIHFHVQRLAGGFVLSLFAAACGLVVFSVLHSVAVGFIFVAFLLGITTYLNLLGILATMHQQDGPMTSGRIVVWRNVPILLLSPLISSFVNGYDIEIYLPVIYAFLLAILYQYRKLCHEWSSWMNNIPDFTEKDVLEWVVEEQKPGLESFVTRLGSTADGKDAQQVFREAISAYSRRTSEARSSGLMTDQLVGRVAKGMPYIDWLFKKAVPDGKLPPSFSSGWFTQLGDAKKSQQQLSRGLKEHNIFILFRAARYDIGQNLGLFLIALMDRWVSVSMAARHPRVSLYVDSRARYGICLCILYFSFSVMMLDVVLQKSWGHRFTSSKEPIADFRHGQAVAKDWEWRRRWAFGVSFAELLRKISVIFGVTTLCLWFFVERSETLTLYYLYVLAYTCVIVFQFNRCFTTNVRAHVMVIFVSAIIGFLLGCALHALPATAGWLYSDVIAQNAAAVLAAIGTSAWSWTDFSAARPTRMTLNDGKFKRDSMVSVQPLLRADPDSESKVPPARYRKARGVTAVHEDGSFVAEKISQLLHQALHQQNTNAKRAAWAQEFLELSLSMWMARRVRVLIVDRESFPSSEMGDFCSLGQVEERGVLVVKVGVFGKSEIDSLQWRTLLATVSAEALLYHIARVECLRSHAQAVQAEHFLSHTTKTSKRIQFELATGDASYLKRTILKSNSDLMRHLCWNLDVESEWESIPQSGREAIVDRITGQPVVFSQELWKWTTQQGIDLVTADFHLHLALSIFRTCSERYIGTAFPDGPDLSEPAAELKPVRVRGRWAPGSFLQPLARALTAGPLSMVKWTAVVLGGGSNIERELWHGLHDVLCGRLVLLPTALLWKTCRGLKDWLIYALLVYHRPTLVNITRLARLGERRKINGNAMMMDQARNPVTAFALSGIGSVHDDQAYMTLEAFDGLPASPPLDQRPIFKARYDEHLRLVSRKNGDGTVATYKYGDQPRNRRPRSREVVSNECLTIGMYDKYGRIKHGIMGLGNMSVKFSYHYKVTPRGNANILAADFMPTNTSGANCMLSVFWGLPPQEIGNTYDWVPSDKVFRIVRHLDGKRFVTEREYRHRRDPISTTVLERENGSRTAVAREPRLPFEQDFLLQKPKNLSFDSDDVLIHHNTFQVRRMRRQAGKKLSILSRWTPFHLWNRKVYLPIPTWRIRTELWNTWLKGGLDAATACWIDEMILREEPLLRKYWRAREWGKLEEARQALDESIDQIVSAIDLETDISELCLLPIRTADLYAMGLGHDATEVTNRPQDAYRDTKDRLSVIVNDMGCWPEAPGGVSNCRRDLVNGHSTIRNHVLAECANDFGIPRFQVEKSVQSLKLLPLWGLDGKTAYHGLMENMMQSQVDDKIRDTDMHRDVVGVFVPLLRDFVKGARTKNYSRADLVKYTNVFLSMSKYYEHKDYNETWNSKVVKDAWAEAWLIPYNDDNITEPSQNFGIERPSMSDFEDARGIFISYFLIFSVNIPEACPRVFQSTHHGISSLFGMLLKYRRDVTFGIWDHAILWRETCLNISPAQCELSVPVQAMLLAGVRLASRLAYFHADIVVPCTSLFNPMWETAIGTDSGKLCSGNEFARKIDPIVNGISDMESFTPVDKVRTETPTVVMLSNIQFIKGIKTAILAADTIVNRYGFKDYKLLVYGAKDRQPSYALEMAKLIVKCNLSEHLELAGFGKPKEVLKDAWLFVNSSMSEGLPLAIGEAALAGVPIVATEVGATALVVTDPADQNKRYGEVVAPNDAVALARAQLSLLSMTGPWTQFTAEGAAGGEAVALPEDMSEADVEWVSQRMHDKSEDRRRLGLLSREVVLHSFHGRRYLREHEQMYWIQWHMARMRADQALGTERRNAYRFGSMPRLRYKKAAEVDKGEEEGQEAEDDNDNDNDDDWKSEAEDEVDRATLVGSPSGSDEEEARRGGFIKTRRLTKPMPASYVGVREGAAGVWSPGVSTAASSFSNWAAG